MLDVQHGDVLTRAVLRLLGTEIAVQTYSQIIDGVPLFGVARGQQKRLVPLAHPINSHVTLRPGVADIVKRFRAEFSMKTLKFDTKVNQARLLYWALRC